MSWCGHIFRHATLPLFRLWHVETDEWLQDRRDNNQNRVNCRESAGFVSRWNEHWWAAVRDADGRAWAMMRGDKDEQKKRVLFLREFILRARQQLELEDGMVAIEDG